MRCKCCDALLNEWESKAKDPADRKNIKTCALSVDTIPILILS